MIHCAGTQRQAGRKVRIRCNEAFHVPSCVWDDYQAYKIGTICAPAHRGLSASLDLHQHPNISKPRLPHLLWGASIKRQADEILLLLLQRNHALLNAVFHTVPAHGPQRKVQRQAKWYQNMSGQGKQQPRQQQPRHSQGGQEAGARCQEAVQRQGSPVDEHVARLAQAVDAITRLVLNGGIPPAGNRGGAARYQVACTRQQQRGESSVEEEEHGTHKQQAVVSTPAPLAWAPHTPPSPSQPSIFLPGIEQVHPGCGSQVEPHTSRLQADQQHRGAAGAACNHAGLLAGSSE